MSLYAKELRSVLRGILYLVFLGAVLLFHFSQFGGAVGRDIADAKAGRVDEYHPSALLAPTPGQGDYGTTYADDPEAVVPAVLQSLMHELGQDTFTTYPIGFYKEVRIDAQQHAAIEEILVSVTGGTLAQMQDAYTAWAEGNIHMNEQGIPQLDSGAAPTSLFTSTVDYDTFKTQMAAIDEIIGGGSSYDPAGFATMGQVPLRYEDAKAEYDTLVHEDKLTAAYARLYCDYMGIAIALFSVFLPVGYLMRDRRAGMEPLIFSRRCSSARLVVVRYLACLTAVMLPVLLLCVVPTVQLVVYAAGAGLPVAPLAFFAYSLGWVGPIAMVCCSVGFFFTILTGTPLGIAVQFLFSFLSIFGGAGLLHGSDPGFSLVPRHNTVGERAAFMASFPSFVRNRIGYVLLALVLLGLSILFYELKRRGKLDVRESLAALLRRRKNAVPADGPA